MLVTFIEGVNSSGIKLSIARSERVGIYLYRFPERISLNKLFAGWNLSRMIQWAFLNTRDLYSSSNVGSFARVILVAVLTTRLRRFRSSAVVLPYQTVMESEHTLNHCSVELDQQLLGDTESSQPSEKEEYPTLAGVQCPVSNVSGRSVSSIQR